MRHPNRREIEKDNDRNITAFPRYHQRPATAQPRRSHQSRRPHRRRTARAWRQARRQRLHSDAQRHHLLEAAYAAMRLGAYAVPVNWHFKPEEINYVLNDSGTSGPDRPCRPAASASRRHPRWRDRPQRSDAAGIILRITRSIPNTSPRLTSRPTLKSGSNSNSPYDGPALPQPPNMIYTSGTTGIPRGCGATRRRQSRTSHRSGCVR